MFQTQQETFDGPLDALLQLIEKEELDITKVSLAKVTDQYLAYVDELEQRRLSEVSEFLVIAARLMLLKSRALLPVEPVDEEDDADDLVAQLAEYKLIKELATLLDAHLTDGSASYGRSAIEFEVPSQVVTEGIDTVKLNEAFQAVLVRIPEEKPARTETLDEHITLEECTDRVQGLLTEGTKKFGELFAGLRSRLAMIVTFLAVLELFKQRILTISTDMKVSLR